MELKEVYAIIDKYLPIIKDNSGNYQIFKIGDTSNPTVSLAIKIMKENDLIYFEGNSTHALIEITPKGMDCVLYGGFEKYTKKIKRKQREKSIISINKIKGDVHGSDLSINARNRSIPPPKTKHAKHNKSVFISTFTWIWNNIWKVIIGVIILIIAYYFKLNAIRT